MKEHDGIFDSKALEWPGLPPIDKARRGPSDMQIKNIHGYVVCDRRNNEFQLFTLTTVISSKIHENTLKRGRVKIRTFPYELKHLLLEAFPLMVV